MQNLLKAKLNAYGLDESSLEYIENYLSDRKKRVKINSSFSNWTNILYEYSLKYCYSCKVQI